MVEQLQAVIDFWFGSAENDAEVAAEKGALWFGKSAKTDRKIEKQFGELVRQAASGAFNAQILSVLDRLAVIILLDQFPRNIHRGKPECFGGDSLALQLVLDGLAQREDQLLRPIERVFFYLPLEHSEDLEMQQRSVVLFARLMEDVPDEMREIFLASYDYAVRHRDIICRFGRFPHRNAILGRVSTPAEIEFLNQPGSSF